MFKKTIVTLASIASIAAQAEVTCQLTDVRNNKAVRVEKFSIFRTSSSIFNYGKTSEVQSSLKYSGTTYEVDLYKTGDGKPRIDISGISEACLSHLPCRSEIGFNSGFDGVSHLSIPQVDGTLEIHCADKSNNNNN